MIRILKRWYLFPILLFLLILVRNLFFQLYIQPTPITLVVNGIDQNLKSKSYQIICSRDFIKGEERGIDIFRIHTVQSGLLDEEWHGIPRYFMSPYSGIVFGNLDFDSEKEILVLGYEFNIEKTSVSDLKRDLKKYKSKDYEENSVYGYYDSENGKFRFKQLSTSPIYRYASDIAEGNFWIEFCFLFLGSLILTGAFYAINQIFLLLRYLLKKWKLRKGSGV